MAARRKQFTVSDEEMADLKMAAADVKRMLDACKTLLDQAENEINLLESDINSEIKSYEMKTAAKVLGIAGAGLFFLAGGTLIFRTMYKTVIGGPYKINLHSITFWRNIYTNRTAKMDQKTTNARVSATQPLWQKKGTANEIQNMSALNDFFFFVTFVYL